MVRDMMYDGVSSRELGLFITSSNVYNAPQRAYSNTKVSGRNGELLTYDGSFQNVEIAYTLMWRDDAEGMTNRIRNWLMKPQGYARLENDYQPDYYRMAMVSGSLSFSPFKNQSGSVEVIFNCKPQLFYKNGDKAISFAKSGTVSNPSRFASSPLIRVYGVGSFQIGTETITISEGATTYIDIDCDIQDCYEGLENRNNLVTLTDFPTLASGDTGIVLGKGITKIEIVPRWWTI